MKLSGLEAWIISASLRICAAVSALFTPLINRNIRKHRPEKLRALTFNSPLKGFRMNRLMKSRFNFSEETGDGRIVLFNTLTCALATVPADMWLRIDNGADYPECGLLAEQGFLVDEAIDENAVLAHWRSSQIYDLSNLRYLVNPTHACNMACSYCIHGARKQAEYMQPDTARCVADFIMSDIELKRPESVMMDFGGAEALLNPRVILYLTENIYRFCRGVGVRFNAGLITNGLTVDQELIRSLVPFGLKRVRTTISGPRVIHDKYRPSKVGSGTYDRIIENLLSIAGIVEIGIAGQYDPSNDDYRIFPELLKHLEQCGLKDSIADVSFGPFSPHNQNRDFAVDGEAVLFKGESCLRDDSAARMIWLQNRIRAAGFPGRTGPPSNRCMVNYKNTMVIDVDGSISVCPSIIGRPDLAYGHVKTGVDFRKEAWLLARTLPDECKDECPVAPLCDGGCRLYAMEQSGDFHGAICMRGVYEDLIRDYMRRGVDPHDIGCDELAA